MKAARPRRPTCDKAVYWYATRASAWSDLRQPVRFKNACAGLRDRPGFHYVAQIFGTAELHADFILRAVGRTVAHASGSDHTKGFRSNLHDSRQWNWFGISDSRAYFRYVHAVRRTCGNLSTTVTPANFHWLVERLPWTDSTVGDEAPEAGECRLEVLYRGHIQKVSTPRATALVFVIDWA